MKKIIWLLVIIWNVFAGPVWAADSFVVKQIDVEGTQRISPETVISYLPIKRGQVLHADATGRIIQDLYKTGFFAHISLARSGNTLIINVVERPTIGQLKISGNNLIPTDKLTAVMKSMDVAEGRVYNRAILDRIKLSLLNQYYMLGRYNARVDVNVSGLPRNRVLVKIDISEGLAAKIRRITIIGNHVFREKTLVNQLSVTTPGLLTFMTQSDQYSQEKLDASVESLRNYYLDHGYLKVAIKSSQVSITPDRKSVYITMVVDEGQLYKIQDFSLTGDFVVPKEELLKRVRFKAGDTFSRQKVLDTQKAITDALGDKGYVYATVTVNPRVDEIHKEVFINLSIKSGKRTYVRHIYFSDNAKTNDEVLRREIQQMEGAPASTSQLEESKRRLNLLPYMKDSQMSLVPVPDTDKVDVNYKVNENNSAELTGRIGYSRVDHILVGAGINQKNFLGTGKTLGLNAQTSRFQRYYSASYTDPYFTQSGISRSLSITASKIIPANGNITNSYYSNEYDAADVYSIPIGAEKNVINRLELGYGYQNTLIFLPSNRAISNIVTDFVNKHGRHFQQADIMAGLSRDSRDRAVFPTRGARQAVGLNVFLPVISGSLTYYTVNYTGAWFHPLVNNYLVAIRGAAAYGNSFSNGVNYPYFKNFYAGGIDSVRGFNTNTLGPKDNLGNPTGGNLLADASVALVFPNYVSDNVRTSLFLDAGNTYQTYDNTQFGGTGSGPLRYSAGVQVEWLSMMGPIDVSLARGLNIKHGDSLEAFQFSLGANFG